MKIKVTNTAIYDFDEPEIQQEYLEWLDGYEATFENLKEFIVDRFVNPNFDPASTTSFELFPDLVLDRAEFR